MGQYLSKLTILKNKDSKIDKFKKQAEVLKNYSLASVAFCAILQGMEEIHKKFTLLNLMPELFPKISKRSNSKYNAFFYKQTILDRDKIEKYIRSSAPVLFRTGG